MEEGAHHGGVESEDCDGEEGVQDAEEDSHLYGLRTVASEVQSAHVELTLMRSS